MEPLPKIARERLQTSPVSDHPDADLLTAFAEQSLDKRERMQVAEHISHCSDCRQVLALASPDAGAAISPASKSKSVFYRRSRMFSWPVLRWGSAAACVVVLSGVGLLLTRRVSRPPAVKMASTAKVETPKVAISEKQTSDFDLTAAQNSSNQPRKKALDLYAKEELRAPAKLPASIESRKKFITLPEQPASKDSGTLLALAPGAAERVETDRTSPLPAAAPSRTDANRASIAQVAPAAPSQFEKSGVPADQKTTAESAQGNAAKADQQNLPQVSEMVEVTGEAPALQTETARIAAKPVPKAKAQGEEGKSTGGFVRGRVSNEVAATAATASGAPLMHDVNSAKWTLSSDGLPQRSFDSGKTWEKVQVDHHVGFRALSAQGMDVWVGGLAGILYHSSDVGMHWTRVIPVTESTTLASDIVTMDFRDSLHGKLTTANQESWITADGGKTWQKE